MCDSRSELFNAILVKMPADAANLEKLLSALDKYFIAYFDCLNYTAHDLKYYFNN